MSEICKIFPQLRLFHASYTLKFLYTYEIDYEDFLMQTIKREIF